MKVAVLLLSGMRLYDLAIAVEVFQSRAQDHLPPNQVELVGPTSPAQLAGGITIPVTPLEDCTDPDVVLIPGFDDVASTLATPAGPAAAAALDFLRARHASGVELASLCTGAFLLAESGLLDGVRATTHWRYAPALQERHRSIQVDPDVIYVHDAGRRLWTSAGVTAGVDMCLAIAQSHLGAATAAAMARSMVLPVTRSGGQAQYVPPRARDRDLPGADLDRLRIAVHQDLTAEWTVARLAITAGLSRRTLQRRFTELGLSPTAWLIEQRVAAAQELLESTTAGVEQIAAQVGFGSSDAMRKHFQRLVSVSPSRYREAFGLARPTLGGG